MRTKCNNDKGSSVMITQVDPKDVGHSAGVDLEHPEVTVRLSELYKDVDVPVRLLAGSEDGIVDTTSHSVRWPTDMAGLLRKILPGEMRPIPAFSAVFW